jgi:Uma2 family endonuclease
MFIEGKISREQFYNELEDSKKVEYINGNAIRHLPETKVIHDANCCLLILLDTFVQKHKPSFVGYEKIMTTFTRNDYEPDLVFFGNEKASQFKPDQTLFPVPDFVVEVLSKSTEKYDRGIKFDDYETHGVKEYWIVDTKNEAIEQYVLIDGKYELILKSNNGQIKSEVVFGFEIPIEAVFNRKINYEPLIQLMA